MSIKYFNIIMKIAKLLIIYLSFFSSIICYAQNDSAEQLRYVKNNDRDSLILVELKTINVNTKKHSPKFYRNVTRLRRAIMISYPIAHNAQAVLNDMRKEIATMPNNKEKNKYIKSVEKQLVKKYTPVLRRMSFYQGAILLKLIDRQTGESGYVLLKELKSGFSAFFYQAIARLYGANLKLKYDPEGFDEIMEQLVLHYELEMGYIVQMPIKNEQNLNENNH